MTVIERLEDQPLLYSPSELHQEGLGDKGRRGRRSSRSPIASATRPQVSRGDGGSFMSRHGSEAAFTTAPSSGPSSGKEGSSDSSERDLDSVSTSFPSFPSRECREPAEHSQAFTSSRPMPWQREARKYYPWLMPLSIGLFVVMMMAPAYMLYHFLTHGKDLHALARIVNVIPLSALVYLLAMGLAMTVVNYVYHWHRLRGAQEPPELSPSEALTHVVIVCSYKEPIEVLSRTFESIAAQRGLHRRPIAVLAAEWRDPTWRESLKTLKAQCGDRLGRLMSTEHVLGGEEAAGKSSNENWAAREVYRELVTEQGLDPFEIVVSIVDADSCLSDCYLAHVEASFRAQPDGRRLIYNGPLNVYRNFGDANLLVQCLELVRCHQDTFHNMFSVPYPYSNYSLTMGFAAEIGFWTPDNMPEDIHTVNKAMVNSFGSRTTVTIPAIICNDLVTTIADRYQQAKRHQWGSVSEMAWLVSLLQDMGLQFPTWWAVFSNEAARAGSFVSTIACLAIVITEAVVLTLLNSHWAMLPSRAKQMLVMGAVYMSWQWLWFWVAEMTMWTTQLQPFPIKRPSVVRWAVIFLTMPLVSAVNKIVFLIVPTLHALHHATFRGELAYVCAPKGDSIDP
mmetsp:Transcript_22293/g.56783  ORF Transcript_22293/g.56783 Transcript_22293/m.56783 type:complete len:621 (-) Transcript_22293:98-1960(-)